MIYVYVLFFFKQKTAYEMRISDWSSDVCSSDLRGVNVVSMTPFVKLDGAEIDFQRLCDELNRERDINNVDIQRGTTLRDDNIRYLKLTRYVLRTNLRYIAGRISVR